MLQPRGEPNLPHEPFGCARERQIRADHLQSYPSVVLRIVREVHHGHSAATELALNRVTRTECALKMTVLVDQGTAREKARKFTTMVQAALAIDSTVVGVPHARTSNAHLPPERAVMTAPDN